MRRHRQTPLFTKFVAVGVVVFTAFWTYPTQAQIAAEKLVEAFGNAGEKIINAATAMIGGANIKGDIKVDVVTGEVIAIAEDGSEALIGVCSASGVNAGGDYECTARTGDITVIASKNSKARVSIGTTGYR